MSDWTVASNSLILEMYNCFKCIATFETHLIYQNTKWYVRYSEAFMNDYEIVDIFKPVGIVICIMWRL